MISPSATLSAAGKEVELMQRAHPYRARLIICALLLIQFHPASTSANLIQYAWSGNLVLAHENGDDPWFLGNQGKHFDLDAYVDRDASDLADQNVEEATYQVVSARLKLNGQEIPYVGQGIVDITDNWGDFFDLLTFSGNFQQFGETIEIGSLAPLPTSTITLTHYVNSPPTFPTTPSIGDRAACCGGIYASLVISGTPVTAVPEPATVTLIAVACVSLVLRKRLSSSTIIQTLSPASHPVLNAAWKL